MEWLKTATFVFETSMFDDDSHDSMMFNDFKRFKIGFVPFYF